MDATDLEPGQTKSFAIVSGNINNAFKINATTGQLTVNNATALNHETTPQFSVVVAVTDNGSPVELNGIAD